MVDTNEEHFHSVILPYQTVDFTIIILSQNVMTKFSKIDEKLSQIKSIYDHDNSIKDGPLGRKI